MPGTLQLAVTLCRGVSRFSRSKRPRSQRSSIHTLRVRVQLPAQTTRGPTRVTKGADPVAGKTFAQSDEPESVHRSQYARDWLRRLNAHGVSCLLPGRTRLDAWPRSAR
jgi:hypothetical protein